MSRALAAGLLWFVICLCTAGCANKAQTPEAADAAVCASGETQCGNACVDSKTDPRHCGQCGHACAAGTVCAAGTCVVHCPAAQTECGGGCFDLSSATAHCGACGHVCGTGEDCVGGDCQLACPEGQTACADGCFDLSASAQHCGTCTRACDAGEVCAGGECRLSCPAGQTACSGACYSLSSEREHCGSCDRACGPGQVCVGGECSVSCPEGETECTGNCFDLNASRNHCGGCAIACGQGELCVGGECKTSCPAGQVVCDGACVTLATSREHCGGCNSPCLPGQICAGGQCEVSCGGGLVLCAGSCVDSQTDRAHCGSCGHPCAADEICDAGACQLVCAAGLTRCGNECRDTRSDRAHCGACNSPCAADKLCVNGQCELNCTGYASNVCDGACTNTQIDPAHCGTCATACSSGAVCVAGECTRPAVCTAPNVVCGSSCTSTLLDPANCGSCGTACVPLTNANSVCVLGACANACAAPYGDCNGDLLTSGSDGCEINLATTTVHCGACGHVCTPPAHAAASCVAGTCEMGACAPGYADCDGQASNGCEVNIATDGANCGSCGHSCGTGSACAAGACVTGSENCGNPNVLVNGQNSVGWYAAVADYWTAAPASGCPTSGSSYTPTGPDVVFKYVSRVNGFVEFTVDKPASNRWHMVTSQTCGTITPNGSPYTPPVVNCISEFTNPYLTTGYLAVTPAAELYLHLVSTTSGGAPLANPMSIMVNAFDCATDSATITSMSPANGSTTLSVRPRVTLTATRPISTTAGSFTVTGNLGTTATIPVTQTANVTFSNSNKTVSINPSVSFLDNELVTVTWTGVQDSTCNLPLAPSSWTFSVPAACPATGRVGTTITRITPAAPIPTTLYAYGNAVPDTNPNGWVYLGSYGSGTTTTYDTWRVKKDGTVSQNVRQLFDATNGATKQGYAPVMIDGLNIYTLDNTNGATGVLWRISTDGGATFVAQDMASFSPTMNYLSYAGTIYAGRIYILTRPTSATASAEIWAVDPSTWTPTTPAAAVKLTTLPPAYSYYCAGLGVDAANFYALCGKNGSNTNWALIRLSRSTGSIVELTATDSAQAWFPGSSTGSKAVLVADRDGDGLADFLYVRNSIQQDAYYVYGPTTAAPCIDRLVSWNATTSGYGGLGYDPVANVLWGFDGASPQQLIKIQ